MNTRIYVVSEDNNSVRLIEAISAAQALKFVVTPRFHISSVTQKELVEFMKRGG